MDPGRPKHHFWQTVLIEKYQKARIPCVHLLSCQKSYVIVFQNSQKVLNFVLI